MSRELLVSWCTGELVSASYAFAPKRPGLRCPLHCSGTHFGLVLLALVLTMGWCTALVLAMSMCCSGVTLVGAAPSTGVYYIFWLVLLHRCILWALAFVHTIGSTCIALWVKSGNRGNLKCLKVNDDFALIFHRKVFISFLSDSKLPEVLD